MPAVATGAGPGRGRWTDAVSAAGPPRSHGARTRVARPVTLPQAARSWSGSACHRSSTDVRPHRASRVRIRVATPGTSSRSSVSRRPGRSRGCSTVRPSGLSRSAGNLTGMRPIWVVFTLASTAACWIAYFVADRDVLLWAVVSTLLGLVLVPLAFWVLPGYVRTKATYYAESFFGTLSAVDRARGGSGSSRPTGRPRDAEGRGAVKPWRVRTPWPSASV